MLIVDTEILNWDCGIRLEVLESEVIVEIRDLVI